MQLEVLLGVDQHGPVEVSEAPAYPGLGESAAEWIVSRRVKTFGVDSPTPDNPTSTTYPVHMMCRREHITHYENLAHLDEVVNTRFTFAGFPLKLRGAHGGPTRAVALIS